MCRSFHGPASIVQLPMLACGERDTMVMAPPPMHDSAVSPCSHGYLAFLHRHFPPQSPPSHPLDVSLCSQQLHNPSTPAPSHCAFEGTCFPVQGMYDCGKDCLILIPCRLPQISCFTLSLKCFSSDSDNCPDVGLDPCLSSSTRPGQVQAY